MTRLSGVCAVVVTYCPDETVWDNLAAIRPQVESLVVIDNGSDAGAIEHLRKLSHALTFALIENKQNCGIGRALNQGITQAQQLNLPWVSLFDQDSLVTTGYVAAMLSCAADVGLGIRVGILVPQYVDRRLGMVLPARRTADGNIAVAMTSGMLLPLNLVIQQGLFVEDLFVGGIDFEYSLRLRSRGLILKECPNAILLHAPASPKPFRMLGKRWFYTSNYTPIRRYYSERNRVWLRRRYRRLFPGVCFALYISSLKEYLKVIIGEERRVEKLTFMLQGTIDGLRNRMGVHVVNSDDRSV